MVRVVHADAPDGLDIPSDAVPVAVEQGWAVESISCPDATGYSWPD